MSNTNVLRIKIPMELKQRLEREAQSQGTSVNQLTTYLLTTQLTQLEALSSLEAKLARSSIVNLKKNVKGILEKVPDRPVPQWDKIDN